MADELAQSAERRAAEAIVQGFRQALGPFVVAAETTRMPMMFTDAKSLGHPIVFVNQAFLELTGYEEHEVMGQSFNFLMERGTDPEMLAEIRTAFAGGRDLEPLVRYRRKDDTSIWVSIFITPVRNEQGVTMQHFISLVNVTRYEKQEDRLRVLSNETD